MTHTDMEGVMRRLARAIEVAEKRGDSSQLRTLIIIRDGSLMGRTDRGSNVARLHDRERKINGW